MIPASQQRLRAQMRDRQAEIAAPPPIPTNESLENFATRLCARVPRAYLLRP